MSWQHLAINENEASASLCQLPRTYEWEKCWLPTGSICWILMISPRAPESMICFTATLYGEYRRTIL